MIWGYPYFWKHHETPIYLNQKHHALMPPHSLVVSAPAVALWAPLQGARLRGQGVAARSQNVVFTFWYLQHICRSSKEFWKSTKCEGEKTNWKPAGVVRQHRKHHLSQKALGQQMGWGNSQNAKTCKKDGLLMSEMGFKCDFILGSGLHCKGWLVVNEILSTGCHRRLVSSKARPERLCAHLGTDRDRRQDFFLLVKKWINPGDIIDSSQIYVDENEWRNEWSTCRAFWYGQLLTLVRSSRRLGGLVPMKSHAPRLELPILHFSDGFYCGMPDSNQKMVRRSFKKCSCRQGNMLGIWRTATNNNSQSWLEDAKPRGILKASQMFSWQRFSHVGFRDMLSSTLAAAIITASARHCNTWSGFPTAKA